MVQSLHDTYSTVHSQVDFTLENPIGHKQKSYEVTPVKISWFQYSV